MQATTGIENLDIKEEKENKENDGINKDGDYADPVANFLIALKAPETKRQYPRRLEVFFDFLKLEGTFENKALCFYHQALKNPRWLTFQLVKFLQFQKERATKKEMVESTISNYFKAIKLFCEMNEIDVKWKIIKKGLPSGRHFSEDRVPTLEEIKKLLEFPDRRIKPIVLLMISSGMRVGAFDYLKWKHIIPIFDEQHLQIIAAKIIVYAGDREEYFSFITPEAYREVKNWMEFRASFGENITGESWIIRDMWQSTSYRYCHRVGLAQYPKRIKSSAIGTLISRALWEQDIRKPLQKGERRHEFKAVHGFKKIFKTQCEKVMKSLHVEILMGHDVGLANSYYKPNEQDLLNEFLKASTDLLTINSESFVLNKQIQKLEEENKKRKYLIKGKLQEREDQLKKLEDKYEKDMKLMKEDMENKFKELFNKIDIQKIL
jgi:hypothetical protein